MPGTSDFQFVATLDASDVIHGAEQSAGALAGMSAQFDQVEKEAELFASALASKLGEAGIGASGIGENLSAIAPHAHEAGEAIAKMGEEGESSISKLKEGFHSVAELLGGGLLAGGAAFALHGVFEAGKESTESIETYKTSLMQAGVAEDQLASKQAEGQQTVKNLSDKYGVAQTSIREMLGQMTALSGQSGPTADKLTQIGLAFEHVGIPARSLRLVMQATGEGGDKAFAALAQRVPGLANALQGANTPAERLDAIFKAMSPTMQGMAEEMDGPVGKMKQLEVTSKDVQESVGNLLVVVAGSFLPILKGAADLIENDIVPAFEDIGKFVEQNKTVILVAVGAFAALKTAMAIKEAGGLVEVLGGQIQAIEKFSSGIIGQLIPSYAAKHAAEAEDATLAKLTETANNEKLTAVERLEAAEQKEAILKARAAAVEEEAAAQTKLNALLKQEEAAATEESTVASEAATVAKEGEVAATEGASVAQGILNAVMDANPIFLLVAGIGAVVGAFALFSSKTKDLKTATEDAGKALADFNTEATKTDATDKQSASIDQLANSYDQLSQVQNPTAAQQQQLADVTDKLAAAVPGAVTEIDKLDESGKKVGSSMKIATDAVRLMTDEQKKQADEAKADALQNLKDQAAALGDSYHEATQKLSILHQEQNYDVELAKQGGLKNTLRDVLTLGFGDAAKEAKNDTQEIAKMRGELNDTSPKLRELIAGFKEQGLTTEQIAQNMHLTTDEVKKFEGEEAQAKQATQAIVDVAAELAGKFDDATKAATELRDKETKAAAELALENTKDAKDRAQAIKDGDTALAAQLSAKIAQNKEDEKSHVANATAAEGDVKTQDKVLNTIKMETGEVEKKVKAGTDLVALQESENKYHESRLKTMLLEEDQGKLTMQDQIKLLQTQAQGLPAVLAAVEADEKRSKDKKTYLDLLTKEQEIKGQQLELERKISDELDKQSADLTALVVQADQFAASIIKAYAELENKPTLGLDAIQLQITSAEDSVVTLFDKLSRKPDLSNLTDALSQFVDTTTGKLKEGIDPVKASIDLSAVIADNADALDKLGIKVSDLKSPFDALFSGLIANQKEITKELQDEEKVQNEDAKQAYDERAALTDLYSHDELDKLRQQIQSEELLYEQQRHAAVDAHDTAALTKLDEAYYIKQLQEKKQLNDALKAEDQKYVQDVQQILGPGFQAVWSIVNKAMFDPLDKALHASDNAFGAFASGVLKNLASMGEKALEQVIVSQIAATLSAATTTATMQTILASAIPAATAVSIASFGGADIAAGTAMAGTLGAMEALFQGAKLFAGGGVTNIPTVSITSENYQRELIMPEKNVDDVLAQKITQAQGGGGHVSKKDMEEAFSNALQANPSIASIPGHMLEINRSRSAARLRARQ